MLVGWRGHAVSTVIRPKAVQEVTQYAAFTISIDPYTKNDLSEIMG
jgi:hypothetical protein